MGSRRFIQIVYRMPAKPTAGRVAVWRTLKKAGAVYLQDSVCVLPDTKPLRKELEQVLARIDESGGSYHLLPLGNVPLDEEAKLVQLFVGQSAKNYAEIVEDCEVNFVKEIEFENFRQNYTYEEAEEIRMEFEKICTWLIGCRSGTGSAHPTPARPAIGSAVASRCSRSSKRPSSSSTRKTSGPTRPRVNRIFGRFPTSQGREEPA